MACWRGCVLAGVEIALKANIQHAATKITNIDDLIFRLRLFSRPDKLVFSC